MNNVNKLIASAVVTLGVLAAACAADPASTARETRSAAWQKNLALAVNDAAKATAAIQAMPEAERAAFAADVLAVLQTKRQVMADKAAWENSFAETAAALVAGAGGAKKAVLAAVAAETVNAVVAPESRELVAGSLASLGALAKLEMSLLKGQDRVDFANALLQAVNKQKAADAGVHKLAMSVTALSLFAGAGNAKKDGFAEVFAVVDVRDLGAVAKAFSDAFGQRKNNLGSDDYLQAAMQLLQGVVARIAGQPDAADRFAYAVSVFLGGANNPVQFEQDLMGKLADLLGKIGATKESFTTKLAATKADMAANAALVSKKTMWGLIILPPGSMMAGEEGPPFVHENRPPGGYQNQGIGKP
ncbi:MAG: hypothetical protein WCI17_05070 [bacterium]